MSDSLRDQLMKAGFKPSAAQPPRNNPPKLRRAPTPRPPPNPRAEPDLAQAFAMRAKAERAERDTAEREARAKAEAKRMLKRQLQELLGGAALNVAAAELPRNFEFAGKIRRIYVTAEQLQQLNAGALAAVMHGGRAVLVDRAVALRVQAVAPDVVALLVDPSAAVENDGVPDDLVW